MSEVVRQSVESLCAEFKTLTFAREAFPMLTDWGVEDFSHTIHSLGCNYLSALGRQLGHWAISDYPVRVPGHAGVHSIRPDVVWWSREKTEVALLGEFERFEPRCKSKFLDKARNLLQAHQALGEGPRILLLVGWTLSGTECGAMEEVRTLVHTGFRPDNAIPVPGLGAESAFVLATAVFGDQGGARRLLRVCT